MNLIQQFRPRQSDGCTITSCALENLGSSVIYISAKVAAVITALISKMGYAGIALLMAIESACIPVPSEIIMPFAGYLVSTGRFSLITVAVAGAVGCNIGSTIAYLIGAYGGRRFVNRWGRYVLLNLKEMDQVEGFFHRFGPAAVLVGRLLPVVRTFVSLPAGVARMPFWKFQVYSFAGSLPWCFALAYAGLTLGEHWDSTPWLHTVMQSLDAVIAVLIVGAVIWHIRTRRPSPAPTDQN